jgi:hypothetical protein
MFYPRGLAPRQQPIYPGSGALAGMLAEPLQLVPTQLKYTSHPCTAELYELFRLTVLLPLPSQYFAFLFHGITMGPRKKA